MAETLRRKIPVGKRSFFTVALLYWRAIGAAAAEVSATSSGLSVPDWLTGLETVLTAKSGYSSDSISERRSGRRLSLLSHQCQSSDSRMTGIRWWMGAIIESDSVMMVAADGFAPVSVADYPGEGNGPSERWAISSSGEFTSSVGW